LEPNIAATSTGNPCPQSFELLVANRTRQTGEVCDPALWARPAGRRPSSHSKLSYGYFLLVPTSPLAVTFGYCHPKREAERNSESEQSRSDTTTMPLDTSAYSLALLRVDGRRWNELRRLHAQIRTQAAADGSSYLEMGHTKVMCVVTGPSEPGPRRGGAGQGGGGSGGGGQSKEAEVAVSIVVAGFSSVDRKRRARGDK
jgi:hypothetical protein